MKHLLDLESLTQKEILTLLESAKHFLQSTTSHKQVLFNKTVINLFFENSTRTRVSFEIAAKRLGADVINLAIESSSAKKGESLLDTVNNLCAMHADCFIVRHPNSGVPKFLADNIKTPACIINAGDGSNEHPSQGLLDLFTIKHFKKEFNNLKVTIVGDILHSRVARSLMQGLRHLGNSEISVVGPSALIPADIEQLGVKAFYNLNEGIKNADVIVMLRLQKERMKNVNLPSETEYHSLYGLDEEKIKLAKKDVIVMHPGPINREVEISSAVADGPHSVILKQVEFGVAVRMAIMTLLMNPENAK